MALESMERVLVVGASADSSILDVEVGWTEALTKAGYDVYPYSLRNRLKMWSEMLGVLRDGRNCDACGYEVIPPFTNMQHADQLTIIQAASDCIVHEALRHKATWAMVISGCSLHPNAAAFLQQVGIPVVTIVTESPYNDKDMEDLAKVSTYIGVNDLASVAHFGNVVKGPGGVAEYMATGFRRELHTPGAPTQAKASDVFFCGTGFDERARLFKDVNWSGIDFKLAGFWPRGKEDEVIPNAIEERLGQIKIGHEPSLGQYLVAGLLDNAEVVEWYRSAKIVLSVHRDDERAHSFGPRVYEAAAVGAFQVCDDSRPEVKSVFGHSVPTYHAGDPEHLEYVIRYWLDRPAQRVAHAEQARKLVQQHSYDDRLGQLEGSINRLRGIA